MSGASSGVDLRAQLRRRVTLTVVASLVPGLVALGLSPAGGPPAGLLDVSLLGLALWLGRTTHPAQAPAPDSEIGAPTPSPMSGNQVLLLLLAVNGAAILVLRGTGTRPLHGLAVAPFAMAAFALSSGNSRDLRSAVLAAAASLGVLSVADDRPAVMVACIAGLVVLSLAWIAVRELMVTDAASAGTVVVASGPRPWGAAAVARLVLLTAVVALLLPTEPAARRHGSAGSPDNSAPVSGERGFAIGMSHGPLDLRQRGTLDSQPVIAVPASSPTLWQGAYADRYDGSTWARTSQPRIDAADSAVELPLAGGLPAGVGLTAQAVTPIGPQSAPLVYSPGPVVAVDAGLGELHDLHDGTLIIEGSGSLAIAYTVLARDPGAGWTGALDDDGVPVSDPRWLQLPAELPQRVRALARTVTVGAATTQDKVAAVEDYLRTHEKYELDSPVPGAGQDAVDAFLLRDHVGFCEQFASAETVLLRSLGIPARVATGFGGDGAPASDGTRVYRNQDAHAWVQVGYPGQRWVDSDPTAGSQLAAPGGSPTLRARLARLWKELTGTQTARRLLALALLSAALLGWRLVLVLRRRWPRRGPAPVPVPQTDAGLAYHRLLARLVDQQRGRQPTETVRDVLARVGAGPLEVVAGVLEAGWYGAGRVDPASVGEAVAVLDGLALPQTAGAAP